MLNDEKVTELLMSMEGMSNDEIAAKLGVSVNTVRQAAFLHAAHTVVNTFRPEKDA